MGSSLEGDSVGFWDTKRSAFSYNSWQSRGWVHLYRPRCRLQFHCVNSTNVVIAVYCYLCALRPPASPINVESTNFQESAGESENALQDGVSPVSSASGLDLRDQVFRVSFSVPHPRISVGHAMRRPSTNSLSASWSS